MSRPGRTSTRRPSRLGSNGLSFFLGVFVAACMCGLIYARYKTNQETAGNVAMGDPSRVSAPQPNRRTGRPQGTEITGSHDDSTPRRIVPKPPKLHRRQPPETGPATNGKVYARMDDPKPTGNDELLSATMYHRYLIREYSFAFRAESDWIYLELVFKSYRHEKWDVSREEWCSMQDSIWVTMKDGKKYTCKEMWDRLYPDDNYRIVKMLFYVPARSQPRELLLNAERWLIRKVEQGDG